MFDLWSSNERDREYRHRMTNEPEQGLMHAFGEIKRFTFLWFLDEI